MLRYKMLARDVNSDPTQYRTWIVPNIPDFTAQYYAGPKSGRNPFVDFSAYVITDDSVIADFDLPLPTAWSPPASEMIADYPIRKVLPAAIEDSQIAVIDGYAYMFGGKITNKIYIAGINNPADWTDTGFTLPTNLYGASLAIADGYVWLFGGNDGYRATTKILSAPINSPLTWTDHGSLLPIPLQYSSLGMYNGHMYLFGGSDSSNASSVILTATASNPLVWTDTGSRLPVPTYGALIAQASGQWLLYGGLQSQGQTTNAIWKASVTSPTVWSADGYLPYATAFGKFFAIGNCGYIVGPMASLASPNPQLNPTGFTPILKCSLSQPNVFLDTQQVVRGVISHSQLAIIYDRVWLFGGSGESAIFACNQELKYDYYNTDVQAYGQITRALLPLTDNLNSPYSALCMPYWLTDYTL